MAQKTVQTVGVKYVIENANQFLNQLNQIQKRIGDSGKTLTKAQEGTVRSINKAAQTAFKAYDQAMRTEREAMKVQEAHARAYTRLLQLKQQEIKANTGIKFSIDEITNAQTRAASSARMMTARMGGAGGIGGALGGIGGVISGISGGAGATINAITSAFRGLAGVVGGVLAGAFKTLMLPATTVWKLFSNISNLLTGHLSLGGIAFAGVLYRIAELIRNMSSEVFNAAANFQKLEIQFTALAARDIAQELGISVGEAMQYASQRAEELAQWVREIAVSTPFTVASISEALAFANAMGLNVQMAQDLTLATGNFTSAMGLTEEHLQRIIYNFGQIMNQGKLTGREFRDLAISFVPVNDILAGMAEEAGMTTEAFKELAYAGGIPVMDFFEAFIEMANTNFPDAMEKMARTWTGVQNNIKDFIQVVIGTETLGPVLDRLTNILADKLEILMSPETQRAAAKIGEAIAFAFDKAYVAVDNLLNAFGKLMEAFGFVRPTVDSVVAGILRFSAAVTVISRTLETGINRIREFFEQNKTVIVTKLQEIIGFITGIGKSALAWGYNLIVQYGQGIVNAISTVLTTAMNFLYSFLEGWLAPGSPPRVAPDIDEWGAAAFTEYLRGFSQANFDVLDDIQDALKDSLKSLVTLGLMTETGAADAMYRISTELIVAIDQFKETGELSQQVIEDLMSLSGGFGEELVILYEREMALMAAMEAAEQAQTRLNEALLVAKTARQAVHGLVKEYNAMLRGGASKEALAAKLQEINAQERVMSAAEKEASEAQKQKELADAQVEILEQQVKLQESLIEQMNELVGLWDDIADAQQRAAGGGGAGGIGGEFVGFEGITIPDFTPPQKTMRSFLEEEFSGLFDTFVSDFETMRDNILGILGPLWDTITTRWTSDTANIPGWAESIQRTMERLGTSLGQSLSKISTTVLTDLNLALEGIKSWMDINGEAFAENFDSLARGIEGLGLAIQTIVDLLEPQFLARMNLLFGIAGLATQVLSGASIEEAWSANLPYFQNVYNYTIDELTGGMTAAGAFATSPFPVPPPPPAAPSGPFTTVPIVPVTVQPEISFGPGEDLSSWLNRAEVASEWENIGSGLATHVLQGYSTTVSIPDGYVPPMEAAATAAREAGTASFTAAGEALGTSMTEGIAVGTDIAGASADAYNTILEHFSSVNDGVKEVYQAYSPSAVFEGIGADLITGLKNGIVAAANDLIDEILAPFEWLVQQIKDALGISSPSTLLAGVGYNMMAGLAAGISAGTSIAVASAVGASVSVANALGSSVSGGMTISNPQVSAPAVMRNSTVNFGDVTINNGMDWAMFKSQVHRAILEDA